MSRQDFGKIKDGRMASLYSIANSKGMELRTTDYGATAVSLFVKDKDGNRRDVILGYDDALTYDLGGSYFGATIGRNGNRISDSKITIDGVVYELEQNDRGNNLHSGSKSLSRVLWTVKSLESNKITYQYESPDLEEGYPGNAKVEVTFEVTEENEFVITYHAVSDKKTVFNMTNHSYFNLNGHDSGVMLNHELWINASHYTPVCDEKSIPTGEIASVEGTPFDFRTAKPVGRDIHADHEQIRYGSDGYDHNFAIDKTKDGLEKVAEVYAPESGIRMAVYSDCIGMQLYTANGIAGQTGKGGASYPNYGALCLETQYFPNAINEPNFVTPLTEAGVVYESTTKYCF
jgi:aldose 1-epimerase